MASLILLALTPETLTLLRQGTSGSVDAEQSILRLVEPPLTVAIEAARREFEEKLADEHRRAADSTDTAPEEGNGDLPA